MSKPSRRFDDLREGECRASPPFKLDEEAIRAFAEVFDPQDFHVDRAAAAASPFGGLIASGAHLLALWRRMDHAMNGDVAFICGMGLENVRFVAPARPDDTLTLTSRIVALRPSASRPASGIATMAYVMRNQRGEEVLSLTAVNLVHRARLPN